MTVKTGKMCYFCADTLAEINGNEEMKDRKPTFSLTVPNDDNQFRNKF